MRIRIGHLQTFWPVSRLVDCLQNSLERKKFGEDLTEHKLGLFKFNNMILKNSIREL